MVTIMTYLYEAWKTRYQWIISESVVKKKKKLERSVSPLTRLIDNNNVNKKKTGTKEITIKKVYISRTYVIRTINKRNTKLVDLTARGGLERD